MVRKILIIGDKGLLGTEFIRQSSLYKNYQFIGVDKQTEDEKHYIDITKLSSIKKTLKMHKPDIIINCAAFTNVEKCEESEFYEEAYQVNVNAVENLAKECKKNGIVFIHISSDMVFCLNNKGGYEEKQISKKGMNKYGDMKLEAEKRITSLFEGIKSSDFILQNPSCYIIRTSWLFGFGAKNFIAKIIEIANGDNELKIVDDEVGCPTYVKYLVKQIIYILDNRLKGGIYHISSSDSCSRYDYGIEILKNANIKKNVQRTKLSSFSRKANIANFSILKNTKLPKMLEWRKMVKAYFSDIKQ